MSHDIYVPPIDQQLLNRCSSLRSVSNSLVEIWNSLKPTRGKAARHTQQRPMKDKFSMPWYRMKSEAERHISKVILAIDHSAVASLEPLGPLLRLSWLLRSAMRVLGIDEV